MKILFSSMKLHPCLKWMEWNSNLDLQVHLFEHPMAQSKIEIESFLPLPMKRTFCGDAVVGNTLYLFCIVDALYRQLLYEKSSSIDDLFKGGGRIP